MVWSHSVSLSQFWGEIELEGSQRGLSGHIKHGQSDIVSIEAGSLFGKILYVHLPSRSSFSLRISPFVSSFKAIREPSRLLASSSCHKSDWSTPSKPVVIMNCKALCSRSLRFGIFSNSNFVHFIMRNLIIKRCMLKPDKIHVQRWRKWRARRQKNIV